MKKIVISGYHGFGNCGDEAILVAMVNNLKHSNPDIEIVALSKAPKETTEVYGIRAISRVNIFRIMSELYRADILLSGGGSLLQDVTSTRSIFYYLSIITMAKILRKPVMIYANGIGPIKRSFNRFMTRFIVNNVDIITLRDEDSRYQLLELGIRRPQMAVTADPVFTLEPSNAEEVEEIFEKEGIPSDKPLVGISIRNWQGADYKRIIAKAADNIINKYGCNVLFIPMQVPIDLKAIEDVQNLMWNRSYSIKGKYNVQQFMAIIGKLHVIISMRLHTLIFAAVQKVPMIGLVYDPKVQSFLELVEQPSAGDIENLDSRKLFKLLDHVIENREQISEGLQKHAKRLRKMAEINDEIVYQYIENH